MDKQSIKLTKKIAIFASGTGTNALTIIDYFKSSVDISVAFVLSNKADAGVVSMANKKGIEVFILSNDSINKGEKLIELCDTYAIDLVVLAGFLRQLPANFISRFPRQIINIHPSLLPKYGGKGMYGDRVHQAVLSNKESISGASIHYVDLAFDTGELIAQFYCTVFSDDSIETLRSRIQHLEHFYFPLVIQNILLS